VHTIQTTDATTDASIVCADGHFADTKCTCTTLSFLLDQFLGLLDGLSCCQYGGHLALVLLLTVRELSDDDDGAAKGSGAWDMGRCSKIDHVFRSGVSIEAPLRMRWYCFYVCALSGQVTVVVPDPYYWGALFGSAVAVYVRMPNICLV
jgi:hypothetical protein